MKKSAKFIVMTYMRDGKKYYVTLSGNGTSTITDAEYIAVEEFENKVDRVIANATTNLASRALVPELFEIEYLGVYEPGQRLMEHALQRLALKKLSILEVHALGIEEIATLHELESDGTALKESLNPTMPGSSKQEIIKKMLANKRPTAGAIHQLKSAMNKLDDV
jgi:hypothetical protein